MGKIQKDILYWIMTLKVMAVENMPFPSFVPVFSFSEGHPELNEDYDVGDGGGEHAGDGRPLHREQAHGWDGPQALKFLFNVW